MPGMSGLDLQEHLFERNIQIPVVIITGHGDADGGPRDEERRH